MLIRQMHTNQDLEGQNINSKVRNSIEPEEIDWLLNLAQIQFTKNRISNKTNSKKEGFEETQKRYDDLFKYLQCLVPFSHNSLQYEHFFFFLFL